MAASAWNPWVVSGLGMTLLKDPVANDISIAAEESTDLDPFMLRRESTTETIRETSSTSAFPSRVTSASSTYTAGPSRQSSDFLTREESAESLVEVEAPVEDPSTDSDALREGQRPLGRFPLRPNGLCNHRDSWRQVRTKRSYCFWTCLRCNVTWATLKCPGKSSAVRKTSSPSGTTSEKAGNKPEPCAAVLTSAPSPPSPPPLVSPLMPPIFIMPSTPTYPTSSPLP